MMRGIVAQKSCGKNILPQLFSTFMRRFPAVISVVGSWVLSSFHLCFVITYVTLSCPYIMPFLYRGKRRHHTNERSAEF